MAEVEFEFGQLDDAQVYRMDEGDKEQLLGEQSECTFSWTNKDGDPVVIIQEFYYDADEHIFWLTCVEHRARAKAVRRDGRTAICVSSRGTSLELDEDGNRQPNKTISYKGKAEIITDHETSLWTLDKLLRRANPDWSDELVAAQAAACDHPGRVSIRFVPGKMTNSFDGVKTRSKRSGAGSAAPS